MPDAVDFQVEYATEADATGLARINIISFLQQGLLQDMFPEASQDRLADYKSLKAMKHLANPDMHVLKIVDPSSGEIVGYGRWHIPKALGGETLPELSEKAQEAARDPLAFAPRPMNETLFKAFRTLLEGGRKKYTTENDMMLDLLAILPKHQGRGLSSKLLRWGCSRADRLGVRVYVESTDEGYPIYVKYGWKPLEEVTLDRTPFGGHGSDHFTLMMREPQPVKE